MSPAPAGLVVGVTHHLLYPESWTDAAAHEQTLLAATELPVAGLDLFGPPDLDPARIAREAAAVRACGKRVVYTTPLLHATPGCDPSGLAPELRRGAVELARRHLAIAQEFGAAQLTVVSGFDPGEADRPAALAGFVEFLVAVCAAAAPLPVAIEPMDRTIDKCALVGPTADAAAVVDTARAAGATNLGLLCDMAHVPLLGESFAEALDATGDRLQHVHLGNCLLGDPADPLYGDRHPPLNYPGGLHGPAELRLMLAALRQRGWFDRGQPTLSFEIRPAAGLSPAATLQQHLGWLAEAWETS